MSFRKSSKIYFLWDIKAIVNDPDKELDPLTFQDWLLKGYPFEDPMQMEANTIDMSLEESD